MHHQSNTAESTQTFQTVHSLLMSAVYTGGRNRPPTQKKKMFVTFSLALPACLSTIRDRLAPRLSDMTADLVSLCIAIYIYSIYLSLGGTVAINSRIIHGLTDLMSSETITIDFLTTNTVTRCWYHRQE